MQLIKYILIILIFSSCEVERESIDLGELDKSFTGNDSYKHPKIKLVEGRFFDSNLSKEITINKTGIIQEMFEVSDHLIIRFSSDTTNEYKIINTKDFSIQTIELPKVGCVYEEKPLTDSLFFVTYLPMPTTFYDATQSLVEHVLIYNLKGELVDELQIEAESSKHIYNQHYLSEMMIHRKLSKGKRTTELFGDIFYRNKTVHDKLAQFLKGKNATIDDYVIERNHLFYNKNEQTYYAIIHESETAIEDPMRLGKPKNTSIEEHILYKGKRIKGIDYGKETRYNLENLYNPNHFISVYLRSKYNGELYILRIIEDFHTFENNRDPNESSYEGADSETYLIHHSKEKTQIKNVLFGYRHTTRAIGGSRYFPVIKRFENKQIPYLEDLYSYSKQGIILSGRTSKPILLKCDDSILQLYLSIKNKDGRDEYRNLYMFLDKENLNIKDYFTYHNQRRTIYKSRKQADKKNTAYKKPIHFQLTPITYGTLGSIGSHFMVDKGQTFFYKEGIGSITHRHHNNNLKPGVRMDSSQFNSEFFDFYIGNYAISIDEHFLLWDESSGEENITFYKLK